MVLARADPGLLGVVLSGSAARGMATERSDVDVYVVWAERGERTTAKSAAIDEIVTTLDELEDVGAFGTEEWWFRWSFAWAVVLRDHTGGRLATALQAQATLTPDEQRALLTTHDRLDGFVNFLYRSLKSDRDGRFIERRLDAAEAVPWFLDVVFALAGRVRPYNKYLPWELRTHPLAVPEWTAAPLLSQVERMLAGDPAACREAFAVVDREVRAWDIRHGGTTLGDLVDSWGPELDLLRG